MRAPSMAGAVESETASDPENVLKPGRIYVLAAGKPQPVSVMSGLTDGSFVEVLSDTLEPGDQVVVGVEQPQTNQRAMQPPPGMGGPQFRGPRGSSSGGGGGRGGR
jgi:hypothetical protein